MTRLPDAAVSAGFSAAWRGVRALPEPAARALFDRVADDVHRRNGPGVRQLRANLDVAAPEQDLGELTRAAMRSYLRYWCEAFRLPSWPLPDLVSRTRTVGEEHLRTGFARGPGAIVALPHTANWDWAGAWACATGMPVVAVAERLRPTRVYDAFVAYRASIGMLIEPLGAPDTLAVLERHLAGGRLVCLLSDRDLSRTSVEVGLLGRPARVPPGAALLAQRTGAALIPATFAYDGPEMVMTFSPEVPTQEGGAGTSRMMQQVADAFTAGIRAHPQDWHMMQRVFAS